MAVQPTTYRDIDIRFKQNPINDDILAKTDVNAVKQALNILMLTNPGEKMFDPHFGVGIAGYLFETPSNALISLIEKKIKQQITQYEPRVIFEKLETNYGDAFEKYDGNELVLVLYFYVVGLVSNAPISMTFERIK